MIFIDWLSKPQPVILQMNFGLSLSEKEVFMAWSRVGTLMKFIAIARAGTLH